MGMRNRRFGVEIECNFKRGQGYVDERRQRDDAIRILNGLIDRQLINEEWTEDVGYDGSGIEVRSPILSGARGFSELKSVMTAFTENGCAVTSGDGLHVHHDAPEYVHSQELAVRLVKSWVANEEFIESFVAPGRRNSWACVRDWSPSAIEYLEGKSKNSWHTPLDYAGRVVSPNSRGALNLSSLREHGTLEFRLHQGTVDYTEAAAWIRFGQAFIDSVAKRKRPMRKVTGSAQLLKSIRVAKNPYEILLAKATRPEAITEYGNEDDYDEDYEDDYEDYDRDVEDSPAFV